MSKFAVILPVYNEAETIEGTLREFMDKVVRRLDDAELIVAEDGSRDGTKDILKRLKGELGFTLISGEERKGYTRAFKDALALPKAPVILFSDSDAQHDPEDFHRMIAETEGFDVVGGYKSPRRDPMFRLLMSRVFNTVINALFGSSFRDVNAGFKVIRRDVVDKVLPRLGDLDHCVMAEFMIKAHLGGFRIKEVPVVHLAREAGASIFNARNIVPVVWNVVSGLLRIRRRGGRRTPTA